RAVDPARPSANKGWMNRLSWGSLGQTVSGPMPSVSPPSGGVRRVNWSSGSAVPCSRDTTSMPAIASVWARMPPPAPVPTTQTSQSYSAMERPCRPRARADRGQEGGRGVAHVLEEHRQHAGFRTQGAPVRRTLANAQPDGVQGHADL